MIISSFCLSLFFELTQLSGLYGVYPRPYRLFDVDDLLLNTTGGWIGCGLARLVMPILPTDAQMDHSAAKRAENVSRWRRLAGFVVDWLAALLLATLIGVAVSLIGRVSAPGWLTWAVLFLWLVGPPVFGRQTLGMRTVRLQLRTMQDRPVLVAAGAAVPGGVWRAGGSAVRHCGMCQCDERDRLQPVYLGWCWNVGGVVGAVADVW